MKKEKFEDYLKQVEDVVKSLESGELGLEESLEKYEVGIRALKKCYEILAAAQEKVEVLIKEKNGTISVKGFDEPR